ncbi:MAG: sulfur reduction protein DsrJ [Chromatiaceae bacterium]|nr:sulfur reduction protein DsrJ [Chromatiaceae bacterium]
MANALLRGSFISLGLAGALLALAVQAAGNNFVVTGSQAANEKSCVEPTDFMRRNHMEVIKHQRDETVHGGIRSTKHSLAGCIACHGAKGSTGEPLPVNDEKQFCGACHDFAAVRLNCFDCHATVPTERKAPLPKIGGERPSGPGAPAFGTQVPPGHSQPVPR